MSPKIKEIKEYDTSFPSGEVLEKHKRVHVQTEYGTMDVWVSHSLVWEKGNSHRVPPHEKNDVLEVMYEYRHVIMKYWKKQKNRSKPK